MNQIDGIHNSLRSDGSTGNGVDVSQSERGNLADELGLEGLFQSLGAEAFGFVEEGVADGDLGDCAGVIQLHGHGHGASEALNAAGVGRASTAAHIHHKLTGQVYTAVNCSGGDGSAGNSVNSIIALGRVALDELQRHGLADKLVGKRRLLGQRAETGGFAEVVAADVDAGDDVVGIHTDGYNDFSAVAANGGFYNIANRAAFGVKTFVAAVHGAAFLEFNRLKGDSSRKQTGARFSSQTGRIFFDRAFGDLIKDRQKHSCNQANRNQGQQVPKRLFVHRGNPPSFSAHSVIAFSAMASMRTQTFSLLYHERVKKQYSKTGYDSLSHPVLVLNF